MWLMRDQANVVFPRKDYKASLTFDSKLKTKNNKNYSSECHIGLWLGLPITIAFGLAVIAVSVANRFLNEYITSSAPD